MRRTGKRIALVPTMGFFHEGHLALMRKGRELCDDVVVSLFVNPTQFGPNEDFAAYPRDTERDLAMARQTGVDAVFMPGVSEMYPAGFQTYIDQEDLPHHLCGLSRPGHFRGVLTVVAKLFHIVRPHVAVFGRKDFQQLAIVRRMARDLDFDIEIYGLPTVREADGLAMSSRNARLSPKERKSALSLSRALSLCRQLAEKGEKRADRLIDEAAGEIRKHPGTSIDYIRISDPETLADISLLDGPALISLAVYLGDVRLIDHLLLDPKVDHDPHAP